MKTDKSGIAVLLSGLLKENPVLVLLLGTCPILAISTSVQGAIGMGVGVIIVLTCSNFLISLLKNIIPQKVRIPAYIVIIAGFVTMVQLLMQAFAPAIYEILGIYLQLIVVNCIILGRAEMFASHNTVVKSVLDGIGMGLGFTLAIVIMASIREIMGSGTWMGIVLTADKIDPMAIMITAPGGFFVYGMVIAASNRITQKKPKKATGKVGA